MIWNRYESDSKTKDRIRLVHREGVLINRQDMERLVSLRDSGQDWRWEKLYTRSINVDY